MRELLASKCANYKITAVTDLSDDDQKFWLQTHPDSCPGLAIGNFETQKHKSYALLLITGVGAEVRQILAVFSVDKKVHERMIRSHINSVDVIYPLPPGKYKNYNGSRVLKSSLDSIALEAIESRIVVYNLERGKLQSLVTSD